MGMSSEAVHVDPGSTTTLIDIALLGKPDSIIDALHHLLCEQTAGW